MKVLMKKNLGSRDATDLGLDYLECTVGKEVVASDKVAEALVRLGLATLVSETMKAVPEPAVAAKPEAPAVKGK